jgi:hypothetical protein
MPKCDIPIKNLRFYGETTNDGVKTLHARHEPQHLISAEVKEHILEYVVKVGEGENASKVIMRATIQGTRAFKRALLETLAKVLQAREKSKLPLCWITGSDPYYVFNGYVTVGLITSIIMDMKDLP